jgi:actin-related protein 3
MLSGKRGTEDLDYFIGDEALAAASGPGYGLHYPIRHGQIENWVRSNMDILLFWTSC